MSFSNDGGNWAIRNQSTANIFQKSINSFQKMRNVDTRLFSFQFDFILVIVQIFIHAKKADQ
jgi:hypothetical protein